VRPGHEAVQSAEIPDDLVARAQIEVIGVGEEYLYAQLFQLGLRHSFDRAGCPHGHEDRRLDGSVGRMEKARPRSRRLVLCDNLKSQWH